jgi:hypothetical protein
LRNDLRTIIRSHEFAPEGVHFCHNGLVWTIFSAPNYEGQNENLGGFVRFAGLDNNMPSFVQYSSAAMKRIADQEAANKK